MASRGGDLDGLGGDAPRRSGVWHFHVEGLKGLGVIFGALSTASMALAIVFWSDGIGVVDPLIRGLC